MLQFQDRPDRIRVVRVNHEDASLPPRSTVGVILKRDLAVPAKLAAAATPGELEEIEAVIAHYRRAAALEPEVRAASLPSLLREVMQYYHAVADGTERTLIAGAILDAARDIRRAERGAVLG